MSPSDNFWLGEATFPFLTNLPVSIVNKTTPSNSSTVKTEKALNASKTAKILSYTSVWTRQKPPKSFIDFSLTKISQPAQKWCQAYDKHIALPTSPMKPKMLQFSQS